MTALLTPPRKLLASTPRPMVASVPPTRFQYTIEQYRKLAETRLFDDKRTMLIDGELYVMAMPNPPHDAGLSRTQRWLLRNFGEGFYVRNQMGFDIGTKNDPGPDLAVVPGNLEDYDNRTPTEALLIVEIADSSLAMDTGRKAELYASAGVPDYWVLDVNNRQLLIFRQPQPEGGYTNCQTFAETDTVAPLAAPQAIVRIADLLPNPETPQAE